MKLAWNVQGAIYTSDVQQGALPLVLRMHRPVCIYSTSSSAMELHFVMPIRTHSAWTPNTNITSNPTSSSILPPSTDGPVSHTDPTFPVLRSTGSPDTGVQGGTDVVGHPHDKLEWEVHSQGGSGHNNRLRGLPDKMGRHQSEPEDWRSVVKGRGQDAH